MKILILYQGYPRISHTYQSAESNELNKKHQWLIYTACPEKKTVGNPVMTQASGVGVIMYKLTDTLDDFVTENYTQKMTKFLK
jgi:hypothetical protein